MQKSKKFKFPPLQEVAFEVIIAPKLKVVERLPDFQELISRDYPSMSEEQLFPFTSISQKDENHEKTRKRLIFENRGGSRMIRISINSFNFIDRNYQSFSHFSMELRALWKNFLKKIGKVTINRIGLRYINKLRIPSSSKGIALSKYCVPHFDSQVFKTEMIERINLEARIRKNGLVLTVRSGLIGFEKSEAGTFGIYLLDYDCYEQSEIVKGDPIARLHRFHEVVESQFLSDVKPAYVKYMTTGRYE